MAEGDDLTGLQVARGADRRRRRVSRTVAWLVAVCLLGAGAGAATAGWWLGVDEGPGERRSERTHDATLPPTGYGDRGANDNADKVSSGADRGLIYQRAE